MNRSFSWDRSLIVQQWHWFCPFCLILCPTQNLTQHVLRKTNGTCELFPAICSVRRRCESWSQSVCLGWGAGQVLHRHENNTNQQLWLRRCLKLFRLGPDGAPNRICRGSHAYMHAQAAADAQEAKDTFKRVGCLHAMTHLHIPTCIRRYEYIHVHIHMQDIKENKWSVLCALCFLFLDQMCVCCRRHTCWQQAKTTATC